MIASSNSFTRSSPNPLHVQFLALLPKLERHATIFFRYLPSDKRSEKIAECVALAWMWLVRLNERGKDVNQFPMAFAVLVARAVKDGRKVAGQERTQDAMNPMAQQRHGFRVESLPHSTATAYEHLHGNVNGQRQLDEFEERLQHNLQTPIPDQAAFRIDFPSWLQTLTGRERRLIRAMIRNERTGDLARQFELSPSRISQMRRQFMDGWRCFIDNEVIGGRRPARRQKRRRA